MTDESETFDVVIIGAGVCGAIAAWRLASAGVRVLVLEAGPDTTDRAELVGTFARSASKGSPGSPYRNDDNDRFAPTEDTFRGKNAADKYYVQPDPAVRPTFRSTYVRRVGGSTWHFLGNMPRFLPADFRLKELYGVGVDWPLSYRDLEEHYSLAETWIGVSGDHEQWNKPELGDRSRPFPMSRIWPAYGDQVIEHRLQGLEIDGRPVLLRSTPQARNSRSYDGRPACAGNSTCVPICPIQAKYDGTVHVRKMLAAGAELRDKCVVTRLETEPGGSTVERVYYRRWHGDSEESVRGRIVLLAAHAVESARLLLLSNLATSSDQVGRNLMDHLQGAVVCIAPEPVYPFRGPPTTSGIDQFRDGEFRRHHSAFRLSLGNDGWGRGATPADILKQLVDTDRLHGKQLVREVHDRFTRMIRFSYSTEMLPDPNNRIKLATGGQQDEFHLPRPEIEFSLPEYNRRAFDRARDVCRTIFEHVGGAGTKNIPEGDGYSGAGHIIGGCVMGTDPKRSVVDSFGRSHDHPNLYILGSTVFPTSGTANPTLTAVALTIRTLGAVHQSLGRNAPAAGS
jgi:glucose dehydrogenase